MPAVALCAGNRDDLGSDAQAAARADERRRDEVPRAGHDALERRRAGARDRIRRTAAEDAQAQAMVVVLLPRGGETWFFKLAGEPAAVAAERERFGSFVGSIRWEEVR